MGGGLICIQGESASGRVSASRWGWAEPPPPDTWDTTGYGQQAGSTHPTGMLSGIRYNLTSKETYVMKNLF